MILSIDWAHFCTRLQPAWKALLEAKQSTEEFVREFHVNASALGYPKGESLRHPLAFPETYLQELAWDPAKERVFQADRLRESLEHGDLEQQGLLDPANEFFCQAIIGSAVCLPGRDPFADVYWARYGPLQVAGDKNFFGFLYPLYHRVFLSGVDEYAYRENGKASDRVYQLLRILFLSERSFPGLRTTTDMGHFPSGDDAIRLIGYASPEEISELVKHGDLLFPPQKEQETNTMFRDRFERSASFHRGIAVFHGIAYLGPDSPSL